jgi:hypothetical protein
VEAVIVKKLITAMMAKIPQIQLSILRVKIRYAIEAAAVKFQSFGVKRRNRDRRRRPLPKNLSRM